MICKRDAAELTAKLLKLGLAELNYYSNPHFRAPVRVCSVHLPASTFA